jgi:Na+-transporting methylmalonyl-CoA/oxaloacetate decarboxylase gamma subunit
MEKGAMLTAAIIKSLQIYGIAIVVSAIVALLIKVLVLMTARLEQAKPEEGLPVGTVCPIGQGVPEEDVAALSAAIFVAIGPHHILHIGQASHGWASGARAAQHSHTQGHTGRGPR